MIDIVGGCYNESCLSPPVRQFYGSGGRAAAALAGRVDGVVLHTFAAASAERKLRRLGALSGFEIRRHPARDEVTFGYVHPLHSTQMLPPAAALRAAEPFHVSGDVVLLFGTVEGTPSVSGGTVIYDPQNGVAPMGFRATGSRAERLAVLCNSGEAAGLTGIRDPIEAGRAIREREGADVVVVKAGPHGSFVVAADRISAFPAYRSASMFGIGSGDVFAAAFALFWGLTGMDAQAAADRASRAVSLYVATRHERIASDEAIDAALEPVSVQPGRVYLAGPFFTMAQRWLVEEARDVLLQLGLEVFSPLHEVGTGPAAEIAPADLAGLETCDRVFAIADGLDAGTVFEIGYARRMGLPVHVYAERIDGEDCKMILGSGCRMHRDFATAIYQTAWKA
jgi:hypothetical protein